MSGTSATGGYITDTALRPQPPDVETVLQQMIAALSGLPGSFVRPRWQPTPPVQPPADTNWASIGVIRTEADNFPYLQHVPRTSLPGQTDPGYDIMQRHSTLFVLASFYGPDADGVAARVRDALYIPQNWESLASVSAKLLQVDDFTRAPELVNQQWINRTDVQIRLRQQVNRQYPIFDLAGAVVDLRSETETTEVTVSEDDAFDWIEDEAGENADEEAWTDWDQGFAKWWDD